MQYPTKLTGHHKSPRNLNLGSETKHPQIVGADRLSHAIVVQFDDGVCAMYPVELLRSLIPRLEASAIETLTH